MLSTTSKLDGIRSWSLEALKTCPGAYDESGNVVPVCRGCYARTGHYIFESVRKLRQHNRTDWKDPTWVQRMVAALHNERYFRWFDSGDIYHPELAQKILEVIRATPWVKHWVPTRSHKLPKIKPILDLIDKEPNAVVRPSADEIDAVDHHKGSVVLSAKSKAPGSVFICQAYDTEPAKCNGCRACWDKNIPVIGYVAHGRTMNKVLKNSPKGFLAKVA